MIHEVEYNYLSSLLKASLSKPLKNSSLDFPKETFITITSSGKAALHLILKWLQSQSILPDKTSTILTPRWLGNWVYRTIQATASPTDIISTNTRAILVYHQYGFPQNISSILPVARKHNLIIIEDCAHALWSYYQNQRLGTIGDFGILSFSKFFPLLMGGAIITKNKDAHIFFQNQLKKSRDRYHPLLTIAKYLAVKFPSSQTTEILEASYALYPYQTKPGPFTSKIISHNFSKLKQRQTNYSIIKNILGFNTWIAGLENDALPYIVPLFTSPNRLPQLISQIKQKGFYSGSYYFDVNRNLFNPNFIPMAWLPVHQGITSHQMEDICLSIKNYL